MAPPHRRGPWVPEEDQLLLQLVREQGPKSWARISQHMHNRSPKQCRERFHQSLNPSLNRESISSDEGLMIESMVNEMGKRWAKIARRVGNRSDNAVKNWWNGSMNRKRRGLSTPTASRTFSRRIEVPYARHSVVSPSPLWADLPVEPEDFSQSHRESIFTTHQASPMFTLPSINPFIETSSTSPTFSEVSSAHSIHPPSLVSDYNSVCPSPPRTLPSPQMLPLPAVSQYETPRPSTSTQVLEGPSSYPARSFETLCEITSKLWWMKHQPTLASWPHPADAPKLWSKPEPEPTRDTRMTVHNLLN
ncbi:hypothetical protein PENARI_c094G10088 [Penicillium arizonense]|uniref:MYB family conidiophore development protein FlbD n=1 Tax=Penicillium arizonense TaxID=1835702 RepID=A0A1F5L1Q4_PENAI|nr:hypothetical protein PENARI_c094G10088 [Penicillium arizonense]OGE46889.1 hypothetical protein PENARI_c094G10088 [Penicillium arizonense]